MKCECTENKRLPMVFGEQPSGKERRQTFARWSDFHLFRKFLLVGSCEGNQKKLTWWHIYSNIFVSFIEEKGLSARYKNASLSSHSFYCWLLPSVLPSFSFTLLALLLVAVFLGVLCDKSIPKWICCQNTFWFMPNRLRISLSSSSILLSFRLVLRFISS